MQILAATNNTHKVRELGAILTSLGIDVCTPEEIGGIPEVEESGTTFEENAILKALGVAKATGQTVVADDSGLEVFALNGEPGVYSARYAATTEACMAKVLERLEGHEDRSARFVCVIALASPAGLIGTVTGEVRGRIHTEPRGHNGFGYDPIFIPDGYDCTFAELDATQKDRISHRGRALATALREGLFTTGQSGIDNMTTSADYFARATRHIPGGVNSPVRAFNSVQAEPVYIKSGKGARMTTVEGRELLDFCGSWGPLILGHAHPQVVQAVVDASADGLTFGVNTPREVEMAELLHELVPTMEMSRLVSSGTEAVMTAVRLARGVTGRAKIIKFDGCYHGHSDSFLVAAGSGLLTGGQASSAGVSPAVADDVFVVPYNDLAGVEKIARTHGDELAAIVIEPVAGNMGLIEPAAGFLEGLRAAASGCGALLIFDEVISGFRLGPTTYGVMCGVKPDLTCLGKIVGGGMPIGAVGGSAEIMNQLAPNGRVYQAGTLSGNPVAVAAGLMTLRLLRDGNPYPCLAELGASLSKALEARAADAGIELVCAKLGGMFTPFFTSERPTNLDEVKRCDTKRFGAFWRSMLAEGIYLSPSQFELNFISAAHTGADIEIFLDAAGSSFSTL